MKKIIKIVLSTFVLLIVLAVLIPFFFKDEIKAELKKQINSQSEATIDFDDFSFDLFRSFPDFNIGIHDLTISTPLDHSNQKLPVIEAMMLSANFWSVINQNNPINISKISVFNPILHLRNDQNERSSYDYFSTSKSSTNQESNNLILKLENYEITNGKIYYSDDAKNISVSLININHSGQGQIYADIYDLETKTNIEAIDLRSMGIEYLNHAKLRANINFKVAQKDESYEFTKANLKLNDLEVDLNGRLQNIDQAQNIDLHFTAINNRFKDFLSLIPGAYTKDFDQVKSDGNLNFNGSVKGIYYSDKNIFPKFNILIKSNDAYFHYPDFVEKVENINLDIQVVNQSDKIEQTLIDIKSLNFDIGTHSFDGNLRLDKLFGNTKFDGTCIGDLDLNKIQNAFPLASTESLSGDMDFDIKIKGNKKAILNSTSNQIELTGFAIAQNLSIQQEGKPKIEIQKIKADFETNSLIVKLNNGKYGASQLDLDGKIDNPIGLALDDVPIMGLLNLKASILDINEWYAPDSESSKVMPATNSFEKMKIDLNANIEKLIYEDYVFTNIEAKGKIKDRIFMLAKGSLSNKSTDIEASGSFDNIWNYVLADGILGGKIKLSSELFNLNDFMTTVPASNEKNSLSEVVLIPPNLDIEIDAAAKEVKYENLILHDAKTTIYLSNTEAGLEGFTSNGLGGVVKLDGTYNTQEVAQPKFSFKYDMTNLKIDQLTSSIETAPILAPILKFIDGVCNSTLVLSGNLTQELFPDFNTLTGQGYLETSESKIKGYRPIQKVNELFSFDEVKNWTIRNTKNWFEIKDGAVEVKEFDYSWQDIDFKIAGTHRLNQDMSYLLKAKIPRALLQKSSVGQLANEGVNDLINAINKAGIPIHNSEYIDVNIFLTGNIVNPKIKVEPVGVSSDSVKDAVQEVIKNKSEEIKDSIKTKITEEKEKVITGAEEKLESVKDSLTAKLEEELATATDSIKEKFKNEIGEKTDSLIGVVIKDSVATQIKDQLGELFGDKAKAEADSIKNKLDKWNPFKKKKQEQKKESRN